MGGGSNPRYPRAVAWPGRAHDFHPVHNDMLFVSDVVAGILLGFISGFVYLRLLYSYSGVNMAPGPLWREMMLGSFIAALVMREPRLARNWKSITTERLFHTLLKRGAAVAAILLSIGMLTRALDDMARLWMLAWCSLFAAWIGLSRLGMLLYSNGVTERGRLRESVVVVGAPDLVDGLAKRLTATVAVVAVIDDVAEATNGEGVPASVGHLLAMAGAGAIDTVIVAFNPGDQVDVDALVQHLKTVPVQIALCADLQGLPPGTRALRMLGGVALAVVADRPLQRWDLVLKAILDRVGASVLLLLACPLLLAAAMAIAWESPGPLIFRQARSGWGGRQFTVYKFRTMQHLPHVALRQTVRNDPRFTRVGAFLRRNSLDELPQLWNVMCGEMSLVGPRPHADAMHAEEDAGFAIVAEYAQRHRVKPGMTGWAQVHGLRGALNNEEQLRQRIEYDLYYIDHWSIWLDIKILARTPCVVLAAENAY
jgi:putative colanic acid biosynthesis UDP-glucose lipid carrier transferase